MSDAQSMIARHLALKGVRLPDAGVATTGASPTALPASQRSDGLPDAQSVPRNRRRGGRRTDIAGDVINPNDGVVVEGPQGHIPQGATASVRQVVEMPMPKTTRSGKFSRTFRSIDGEDYTIRTRDAKGNPLPGRVAHTLYLALIEQSKGGSPLTVFGAFGLGLKDMHGKQIFPVPQKIWETLATNLVEEEYEPDPVASDAGEFSLGDDDVDSDID